MSKPFHESIYLKHLHHFVAEMVNDLHGDATVIRLRERAGSIAVQRCPCFLIDLRFERSFECIIWIIRAQKVSMTNEEALLVVVGINEPARDTFGTVATNFTGVGMKY